MQKVIVSFLLVFLSTSGLFAQERSAEKPVLVALVTKDSVFVKWVPRNFEMFQAVLKNGVDVSYGFNGEVSSSDFGTKNNILPVEQRWSAWDLNNLEIDKIKTLQEGVLMTKSSDTIAKNYAFALASIHASVFEEMNLKSGLMVGLKKNGQDYLHIRVAIPGYAPEEMHVDLKKVTKDAAVPQLTGVVDKKRTATIEWDAKSVNKDYLGFIVERKTDNGKFVSMLKEPYVHLVTNTEKEDKLAQFRDENVEQGKTYTYRITGLNYFGRKGGTSNEVQLLIPRLVNATVAIDTVFADKMNRVIKVHLSKEVNTLPIQASKLQVLRSKELLTGYSTVFEQKITSKDSLFTVTVPVELETGDAYYYKVLVFSTDNDTVYSPPKYFFTLDQEPPKAVTNLKGEIDSLGIVRLTWGQETDKDLQGFRVFYANDKKEEFVERNSDFVKGKQFTDTLPLNTLTNEIYYFVIAVDENFNNSPVSDTILVVKPDTIPPVAPVLVDLISRDARVKLTWENSSSEDVVYQALYRVCEGKTDTLLRGDALKAQFYLDTTMLFGKDVAYQLLVKDRSGNSAASTRRVVRIEPGYRKALENVAAVVNRKDKVVQVTWNMPSEPVFQYFVYRKKNDGKMELIATLDGTKQHAYSDQNLTISSKYEYLIQYQTMEGFRSLKHAPVPVKY